MWCQLVLINKQSVYGKCGRKSLLSFEWHLYFNGFLHYYVNTHFTLPIIAHLPKLISVLTSTHPHAPCHFRYSPPQSEKSSRNGFMASYHPPSQLKLPFKTGCWSNCTRETNTYSPVTLQPSTVAVVVGVGTNSTRRQSTHKRTGSRTSS